MNTFTVPAKYLPMVRAAIRLAVADVGREAKREDRGDPRALRYTHPALVDESLTGQCVIQIGVVDADAQNADLEWPAEAESAA